MRYFNDSDVVNFRKELILENYDFSKKSATKSFDVFLSHSSNDNDILPSVINFLSQYQVNVDIDKSDKALPKIPTSETGTMLKSRIQEAKKFILLVSDNSKDSKWIPWELGIADIIKPKALLRKYL